MAAKKKRVDPVKQREKRVKIAAIVGTVLFALAMAYEVPSMLKVMNKKPPPGTTYDPGPRTRSNSLPNITGGSTGTSSPSAASSGELVDTDVPPPSEAGQLVSFSVFQTKDPFLPQVSSTVHVGPDTSGATTTTPSTAANPGADVPGGTTTTPAGATTNPDGSPPSAVPSTQGSSSTTTPTTTVAAQPTVAISVNGTVSHVSSSGTFPTGAPVFRLVSWKQGSAQIAIVGGSYSAGDATLTLEVGKPVTLENQTTGTRYAVELLST
jgi:hypothetical protein